MYTVFPLKKDLESHQLFTITDFVTKDWVGRLGGRANVMVKIKFVWQYTCNGYGIASLVKNS